MTILEYLQEKNISFKAASQQLGVDSSNFSKVVRGKIPVSILFYKKVKTSFLKDCSLDDLTFSKELINKKPIIDMQVEEELKNRKNKESTEINEIDLNFRLANKENNNEQKNKIINIDRNLPNEIKAKTDDMKKIIEENKKLFRINFKYATQLQNALDCLDDLEIQIQILRNIINRDKYLQELQNLK